MLKQFIYKNLKKTDSGLGDRSTYVGSSDIGQCPKKSYLSKKEGEEHSLDKLLIFQRGHVAEGIIAKALSTEEVKFDEQSEVTHPNGYVKAHVDFVVHFPFEDVIIECKTFSTALPGGQPRESWILQTQLQLGLMREQSKKPIERGYIVAMNLNTGELLDFKIEFNQTLYEAALKRADTLWDSLERNIEPKGEVSDLCPYCPFKGKCDTLNKGAEELPKEIIEMINEYKKAKEAAKKEKMLKENIKAYFEAANIKKGKGDGTVVTVSARKGRAGFDYDELQEKYPEIYEEFKKPGSEYIVLKIN